MAKFVELDVDQGTDYYLDLGLTNEDGTSQNVYGYTFSATIKKSFFTRTKVATFTVNTANANTGNVILSMNAAVTANIKAGRYLFDIKQKSANNVVERISEGIITINPQVTI